MCFTRADLSFCDVVVDVVLPSAWTTSLNSVIFCDELSLVTAYVYLAMSLLPDFRIRVEYGEHEKDSWGGIGYEVISLDAGTWKH
jgi:hypothetical protein